MKVCHTLICFFFLSLQDGNIRLINAEIPVRTGSKGGNITVKCSFSFSGSRKIFCKRECEGKDILIETYNNRAQSGRYSIEYKEGTFPASKTILYVSITKLTKSDSGRYRCWLDRAVFKDSTRDFELRVEDAPTTSKPKRKTTTKAPFTPSVPSASTPTTTQSLSSSSGSSTPSSSSPETTNQPEQQQRAAGPAAVLIFCRKRASKPKEPPVETEYANGTEANRVYEEIREEDRQSRSPSAEISTAYTYAKYSKPDAVETTDEYSLITAAGPQNQTEDDLSKLTYSEVDLSNGAAALLHSAPRGDADNVVYSVPRSEAS
ncbi:uncharacterized protein LOC127376922 isoform X40 [Dicentrarchus labrax]|uniref:uncharacterized protein LOC127376922 isoform X38 n=1 Tax=Dicentrarchus labrax TaxID=13489 RepID=UPI0021F5AF0D|nr:uncharacterized protein LOC127376922 isoform X38 [Dicentrarchus labrax]XP_051280320.1 uncharacterized protein LOC127376922 isoform X39 [Dicentrarchus labrax]XP_051280321.1 uncharacterized protein LOC127376922 isoform X40 [Dicentrarchus labrax]